MQISGQTNNYQNINASSKQLEPASQPIILPPKNEGLNKDLYEASNGNLINDKSGNVVLSPQGKTNVANAKEAHVEQTQIQEQAQKDQKRAHATDYLALKSKQSQTEIYLSVATNSDVEVGNNMANTIESLRDTQKQNNAVKAYATYQENQNPTTTRYQ